jgi:two-component system, OmpR family, sensor histidine kinase CiaH
MFNKLRNKFLILNLVIISITMIIAFGSIYLFTYNNVQREIDMELRKISENNNKKVNDMGKGPKRDFDIPEPPLERSFSFSLTLDNTNTIKDSFSILTMGDEFYQTARNQALAKNTSKGKFNLDGTHWAFMIKPFEAGKKIVFLDISSRQSILTNLIYTFLVTALIMLIVIFFISRFFANRAIEPIKEAFNKQKQFIGDASHELKTPLAVINTNVDVLLSNGDDTIDSQAKWLHYIKSEVQRMSKLTNDLLYLTQMDNSEIKMIFSDFNISETVENVIMTMEAVFFENNMTLDYNIEPNIIIHGNSEQIKQVVMILLDNALKYTNPKGSINLSLKKEHNNLLLSVTNTGKGIAEEYLSKIFDRFYRIDKSRSRDSGGYGLGLAISKAIVEQHGGKISASSTVNKRTTFTVQLPA